MPPQDIASDNALVRRRRRQAAVVRQARQRRQQHRPGRLARRAGPVRMLRNRGVQSSVNQPQHHVILAGFDVDRLIQHRGRRRPARLQASRRPAA